MSFDDLASGGTSNRSFGGPPAGSQYGYQQGGPVSSNSAFGRSSSGRDGDAEYVRVSEQISQKLYEINNNVGNLQRMSGMIGSARDTPQYREKLMSAINVTRKLTKETGGLLRTMGSVDGVGEREQRERRMQQTKLSKDFQQMVRSFDEVQKLCVQKMRASVARAKETIAADQAAGDDYGTFGVRDEEARLIESDRMQAQQQIGNEVEYNEALIREREEGIMEIESTMIEINSTMRDITMLVHEQGQMLDRIEDNIEDTHEKVEIGHDELVSARRYQKKARKKMVCILVVAVIAAAVVATIVGIKVH